MDLFRPQSMTFCHAHRTSQSIQLAGGTLETHPSPPSSLANSVLFLDKGQRTKRGEAKRASATAGQVVFPAQDRYDFPFLRFLYMLAAFFMPRNTKKPSKFQFPPS